MSLARSSNKSILQQIRRGRIRARIFSPVDFNRTQSDKFLQEQRSRERSYPTVALEISTTSVVRELRGRQNAEHYPGERAHSKISHKEFTGEVSKEKWENAGPRSGTIAPCFGCRRTKSALNWSRSMALPISPPYPSMEALLVDAMPAGKEWQYEPKWDGFRCLAFKDGTNIELQSKSGQSLGRYFPELISALQEIKSSKFVLDGEIVIPIHGSFSFDDLLERIHLAGSRVQKLAQEYPANFIVFDLLVFGDWKLLRRQPLKERRRLLEIFFVQYLAQNPTFQLSLATRQMAPRQISRILLHRPGQTVPSLLR
jgi:ATP-dependent DNA ligase